MKYLRAALVVFASALSLARAQDDDESRRTPPVDIPDFSNLDEYIYEPKSTVTLGFRHLSGVKTSFSGSGHVGAPEDAGPLTGNTVSRLYHDGFVNPDTRTVSNIDTGGNPAIDPDASGSTFTTVPNDGRTNSWAYADNSQRLEREGYIAFHTYSADIIDPATRGQSALATNGLELAVSRDMGKVFGSRMSWTLTAGMAVNDISSTRSDAVLANLTTITDLYSLFGQVPPDGPYSAPSTTTIPAVDTNGNPLGDGSTISVDNTVLLGNEPAGRRTDVGTDATSVTDRWKLKGSYFTFRAGPTVWIPITNHLRVSLSLGAVLVYAGTNYTVTESFEPDLGEPITDTNSSQQSKLLPGYYADASVQYDVTDRTGFYAGAVFQSAGSYTQRIDSTNASYSTKVDLKNQNGLRAGMSIRF